MIKRHFDQDLERIRELILRMSAMVEDAIAQSIRALLERDNKVAERVIELDSEIDRLELELDQLTLEIIAKMQPTAGDLRLVVTAMRITPELERVADLAQDVCERAIELNREPPLKPLLDIPNLAAIAQTMVRESIDSFVRLDADLARRVIARDDEVDALTEHSFRELLTYMLEDPRYISRAIRLTFIGKYFERIGDSATNIAEMVVYLAEGRIVKHQQ